MVEIILFGYWEEKKVQNKKNMFSNEIKQKRDFSSYKLCTQKKKKF